MEERTPTPAARDEAPREAPPAIDLPVGAQEPLPFDDESEEPIPFALTARARRTVAPHDLPQLRVLAPPPTDAAPSTAPGEVPGSDERTEADADPSDTRPARARALRRSGVATAAIADQLGVDELLVRAWTGNVPVARPARAARAGQRAGGGAPQTALHAGGRDAADEAARTAFELARAAAHEVARRRLADDPKLAAGLGVLAGIAEITPTAVDVTTGDPRLAAAVVRWLTEVLGADVGEVRLVLRVGPRAAADLARHRWGRAVGIAPDRVRTTRAVATVTDDAVEGVLRVVDRDLAAAAAGWRDALLDGEPDTEF